MSIEGHALRVYRQQQGLTLQELSEKTGVSNSQLSELERGTYTMTVRSLRRISAGLGVSPAELLSWETCPTCSGRGIVTKAKA